MKELKNFNWDLPLQNTFLKTDILNKQHSSDEKIDVCKFYNCNDGLLYQLLCPA